MSNEEQTTLETRIQALEARNHRVEGEKAWETSLFRVLTLTGITYVVAALLMQVIGTTRPFINALIPALGFFLSTQSLPILKRWWIRKHF